MSRHRSSFGRKHLLVFLLLALLCLTASACSAAGFFDSTPEAPARRKNFAQPAFPTHTLFPTLTPSPAPSPSPTPIPTPDPYEGFTYRDLAARAYGGGEFKITQTLGNNDTFTRYLVTYPSDDLTIYGFMNVPKGEGPFPVIILIHGYVEPAAYQIKTYTTRYADALARAGYLVIHPNLRGYPPSDDGPNLFQVGFAVDTLNLIALLRTQGLDPGPLEKADPSRIGLWGHSMGGGVAIRVLTLSQDVKAAVLYGSMSSDDEKNSERIYTIFSRQTRGLEEYLTPAEDLLRISPHIFLNQIQAAVSIHHGNADINVPVEWSLELCGELQKLEKTVECYIYPNQPHIFYGSADRLFNQRTLDFYKEHLE